MCSNRLRFAPVGFQQHGDDGKFSTKLVGLQEYTTLVELSPNERLYGSASTIDLERGLFFIERGIMVRFRTDWCWSTVCLEYRISLLVRLVASSFVCLLYWGFV